VQQVYTIDEIMGMNKISRINFMNTISGFKSANLIASINDIGKSNLAIFSSVIHLGSKPPFFGFVSRPASVERHTLSNILANKFYTINHVNTNNFNQAHQTSGKYPMGISEFEQCGLNEEYINDFKVPFVNSSSVKLAMEFVEKLHIAANDTVLVVGKLLFVATPSNALQETGMISLENLGTTAISGINSYHATKKLATLPYVSAQNASGND